MVYLDTSILAPFFKREATSFLIAQFISDLPRGVPTISEWSRVEFASFLAKEVRMGGLASPEADAMDLRFEAAAHANFTILGVTSADFDLAKSSIADHRSGLRSGDALHLAIAANNGVQSFCSLDKVLARNARAFGLPVNVGLPAPAP